MSIDACCCLEPEQDQRYSVCQASRQEADRFKWIESQHAGRDLGETALQLWIQKHWWGFLRERLIEHLQGSRFWTELDMEDFGLLNREFQDEQALLHKIVSLLLTGNDNLEIILWAYDQDIPVENVLRILERININARRLILEYNATQTADSDECWHVRK
jgi:hypothetical protein